MFGRKLKLKTREPPRIRDIIIIISKEIINCVYNINSSNLTEPGAGAVKIALETNIQEIQIGVKNILER